MQYQGKSKIRNVSFIIIISFLIASLLGLNNFSLNRNIGSVNNVYTKTLQDHPILSSSSNNFNNLESILDEKISDLNNLGYFPQIYQPSLQATYYALFILDAIGKLQQVDQTTIVNYIMSNYNSSSQIFMDKYAYRYLDSDFDFTYYQLSTVLEVNCYAILSLDILGRLDLINIQESINFIWSCYNPIEHGFIGQPYDVNLENEFKISTVDNTHYAIETLDLLLNNNWTLYPVEKNDIILFLKSLQSTVPTEMYFGGFYDDLYWSLQSIDYYTPSMQSAYYAIKTLEVLEAQDSIRISDFIDWIDDVYRNESIYDYFLNVYEGIGFFTFGDIIASTMGLDLSDMYGFTIDRNDVIAFILDNRDSKGVWKYSSGNIYAELIDTYQVIFALKESGEIIRLSFNDKTEIFTGIQTFFQYDGYSLFSKDYTSMNLINSVITSAKIRGKANLLNKQQIYNQIMAAYVSNDYYFRKLRISDSNGYFLRTDPIEYSTGVKHNYIDTVEYVGSHESTFMALDSLEKIGNLSDFGLIYSLNQIVNEIINSQFLESGYENYGGFLPHSGFARLPPSDYLNNNVHLKYSYYAIRALELLANFLSLGDIKNLLINTSALSGFTHRDIIEGSETYYKPFQTNNIDTIMEYTYYMIYLLKAIDSFDLNIQSIKNFIGNNIDYTDIKNIYYSFKIDQILNLGIQFDYSSITALLQIIYSESMKEFYLSLKKDEIRQEIFKWACELSEYTCGYNITPAIIKNIEVSVNISISEITLIGQQSLQNYDVYALVSLNGSRPEVVNFNHLNMSSATLYYVNFVPVQTGNYSFKIYLSDDQGGNPILILEFVYSNILTGQLNNQSYVYFNKILEISSLLSIFIIGIPSSVLVLSVKYKKIIKSKYKQFSLEK
jgi:prenyltransferase beta subunit